METVFIYFFYYYFEEKKTPFHPREEEYARKDIEDFRVRASTLWKRKKISV